MTQDSVMYSGNSSTDRVIHEIRAKYGDTVIQDRALLVAFFSDLAPRLSKERLLLESLIAVNGHKSLLNAVNLPLEEQNRLLLNTIFCLNSQRGIAIDVAAEFCNAFFRGIGGTAQYKTSPVCESGQSGQQQNNAILVDHASPRKTQWGSLAWVVIVASFAIIAIIVAVFSILLKQRDARDLSASISDSNDPNEAQTIPNNPNAYGLAHSSLFSSGERIINYNNVIYALEADGLYRFSAEKPLVFGERLDTSKGFCTNGKLAYVMTEDGRIIRVDIETGRGETLFTDKRILQIVGCDDDYLSEVSGEPLLLLGFENNITGGGWSWGVDLCAVLPDGTVWSEIAQGVEAKMVNGVFIYSVYRSDVSPTSFSAESEKISLRWIEVWSANLNNNVLYYAELARTEDPLSAIALHKNTGTTDTILTTITDAGYEGVYIPSSESDVISIFQRDEDWNVIGCKYVSLDDGSVVFPQLGAGEIYIDRCTGAHY